MIIRKAQLQEIPQILEVYHDLIDYMKNSPYRPTWEKGVYPTINHLENAICENALYIAAEGSDILGACVCNHHQGDGYERVAWPNQVSPEQVSVIHLLVTAPKNHKQGIARQLLDACARDCRLANDKVLRLDTPPWNIPAQRLYESFGFVPCGELGMEYPGSGLIYFRMYEYALS